MRMTICLAMATVILLDVPLLSRDCSSGPDTCQQGYVWREARPSDHVCVTPEVRNRTQWDNEHAKLHVNPNGGAYGPDTCRSGYVWREAYEGDHVCVTATTRAQAAADNKAAKGRKACTYTM